MATENKNAAMLKTDTDVQENQAGTGDRKISEMSEKSAQCPKSVRRYK